MVKFCVLASGSTGNSAFIATSKTRILVDAGLTLRETVKRLASIGESITDLDAVLVTHEHSDHISGLLRVLRHCRKNGRRLPAYLTKLTGPEIDWEGFDAQQELFQSGARFNIGDIEINSFGIPHDARDPVGFHFCAEGVRIGLATDLGYIPDSVRFHMRGVDLMLLESNHDREMLRVGPYPWVVKQRVAGRRGHLSNDAVCEFLREDLDSSTAILILGHLSDINNYPGIVRMAAESALIARGHQARLIVAEQSVPSEVFAF